MSEYPDFQQQEVHEYAVDLVICIDGTYSMHYLIDHVKKQAKDFYQLYAAEMYNRTPPRAIRNNGLRVKMPRRLITTAWRLQTLIVSLWMQSWPLKKVNEGRSRSEEAEIGVEE